MQQCPLGWAMIENQNTLTSESKLEIAQSEQDVSRFCKESDMTYS